jgi:hypothetical protein
MFRKKEYRYSLIAGFVLVVWTILANGGLAWAQNTLVYFTQNGKQFITKTGSTVNFQSGTTFTNAATATNSGTTSQTGAWSASGSTAAISSATTTLSGTALNITSPTTTWSGAAINFTTAATPGTITSNGKYNWVFSAGNAGAVSFADSLSTTGPVFLTSTNTLSGATTISGTTVVSGAAEFTNAAPVHFHGLSGIGTVAVGKDSVIITATGAATTDIVFANSMRDTTLWVQHAYVLSTNNVVVHLNTATGLANNVSWVVFRP